MPTTGKHMATSDEDDLVLDLARGVIAQAAPHELPVFRATAAAYLQDPQRVETAQKDEMLGFGVDALAALTPCVLVVARAVVEFVAEEVAKALKDEGAGRIQQVVRRLLRRSDVSEDSAVPSSARLTQDQLGRVHRLALEKSAALNLSPSQAQLLADSMVGSLVSVPG